MVFHCFSMRKRGFHNGQWDSNKTLTSTRRGIQPGKNQNGTNHHTMYSAFLTFLKLSIGPWSICFFLDHVDMFFQQPLQRKLSGKFSTIEVYQVDRQVSRNPSRIPIPHISPGTALSEKLDHWREDLETLWWHPMVSCQNSGATSMAKFRGHSNEIQCKAWALLADSFSHLGRHPFCPYVGFKAVFSIQVELPRNREVPVFARFFCVCPIVTAHFWVPSSA